MNFKLIGKLKNGEKLTLNKVEKIEDGLHYSMTKILIRGYFGKVYKDKISSLDDIIEIKYYDGRKVLKTFDYSKSIIGDVVDGFFTR